MTFEEWYKPGFAITEDEYERLCICWKAACSAQRQPLSDEQAESLIEYSDGRWCDGEFLIDGPDLMRLLRVAAQKGEKL